MSESSFRVRLPEFGVEVTVQPGQTILDAAVDAGLDYPFACFTGVCGTCKSRLVEGKVQIGDVSPIALPPEEQAAGLILVCCAVPESDCTVAPVEGGAV